MGGWAGPFVSFGTLTSPRQDTSLDVAGCTRCGGWWQSKLRFCTWAHFVELRETDEAFDEEVETDMQYFTPGSGRTAEWLPEGVHETVETGYESAMEVRIATEKDVKNIAKKELKSIPSAMVQLSPNGDKEKVWMFADDDPSVVGLKRMKVFTKVTVTRTSHKLTKEDHTFQSLGRRAFADSIGRKVAIVGGSEIDLQNLPSLNQFFGDDASEKEEGEAANSALPHPPAPSPSAAMSPPVPQSPGNADGGVGGLTSRGGPGSEPESVTPNKTMQSPGNVLRPSSVKLASRDDLSEFFDDAGSVMSDGSRALDFDSSQVPVDLEQASLFWVSKMPLEKIMAGGKLGHAIRQGHDLVAKNCGDESKSGVVSQLQLHCRLANVARTMAPGKKFVEALSNNDLRENADKMIAARAALPLHVHEQFVFRHVARMKENLQTAAVDNWCEAFLEAVVPWARSEDAEFQIANPTVSALAATEASKLEAFRKLFVSEFVVPYIMKGPGGEKILRPVVTACTRMLEEQAAIAMTTNAQEVYMEILAALRALQLVLEPETVLKDFSCLADARTLKNNANNTQSRSITTRIGAALVGTESYGSALADILKHESTTLKVRDEVEKCMADSEGPLTLSDKVVDELLEHMQHLPTFQASLLPKVAEKVEKQLRTAVAQLTNDTLEVIVKASGDQHSDNDSTVSSLNLVHRLVADAIISWPLDDFFSSRHEAIARHLTSYSSMKRLATFVSAGEVVDKISLENFPQVCRSSGMTDLGKALEKLAGLPPFSPASDECKLGSSLLGKLHKALLIQPTESDLAGFDTAQKVLTSLVNFLPSTEKGGLAAGKSNSLVCGILALRSACYQYEEALRANESDRRRADPEGSLITAIQRGVAGIAGSQQDLDSAKNVEAMYSDSMAIVDTAKQHIAANSQQVVDEKCNKFSQIFEKCRGIQGGLEGRSWTEGLDPRASWEEFLRHASATLGSGEVPAPRLREAYQALEQAPRMRTYRNRDPPET